MDATDPEQDGLPTRVAAAAAGALAGEPAHDREVFLARLRRHWPDLVNGLASPYGSTAALQIAERSVAIAVAAFKERSAELRLLDLRRHVDPDWFQAPSMLGYAAYADRMAGNLRGVAEKVPYLAELGVTYLHLLPLLEPREKPNDGGYAVQNYRRVRADLGTMDDLAALAAILREHRIALALDLVLNHVAAEHEWAEKARGGDKHYSDYFLLFPDRALPDAYEATLPEVFPAFAPGNFTWNADLDSWVWTTFNDYQWDLNWSNPDVFCEFADLITHLANQGVECLRLDAIAFVWKRMGTNCQNQPEVHALTQALRTVARIAAPALIFKAEAIVGPQDLVPYLGVGEHTGKVSDLAYHNSLMVQIWSSLAAQDARLATVAMRRFPPKATTTAWVTYLRCHDDIGWAIDDGDAAAVGWNGYAHRGFLSDWFAGESPGSASRGLVFQHNVETGDRRISGSAAALTGLEAAREWGSPGELDMAIRRYLLAQLAAMGYGGVPVLWMGDEVALNNDHDWASDPEHADDNRWAHRPRMPWDVVALRSTSGTPEHRIWHSLRSAVHARARLIAMHAAVESVMLDPVNPAVLGWVRRHPAQELVALHNMSDVQQWLPRWAVPLEGELLDALSGKRPRIAYDQLVLEPYDVLWLVHHPEV